MDNLTVFLAHPDKYQNDTLSHNRLLSIFFSDPAFASHLTIKAIQSAALSESYSKSHKSN